MKKRKTALLASAILSHAAPLLAGPWTVGTGPQPISYSSAHPLGDGSGGHGGEAPAFSYEAPDVPTTFTVGGVTTATWTPTGSGQYDGFGVGSESKARFECDFTHRNKDDAILAPGVPNGSTHSHSYAGNPLMDNSFTYAALRASQATMMCWGGPLNKSGYWEPSMLRTLPSGAVAVIKPRYVTSYYSCGDLSTAQTSQCQRWPRGIKFIDGFNMADPTDSYMTNIVAAANAANVAAGGSGSRYTQQDNGFKGWACVSGASGTGANGTTAYAVGGIAGGQLQPYLVDANGHTTLSCVPGTDLQANVHTESCWDGKNLDSPDGRKHVLNAITDGTLSGRQSVCPDGWFFIPSFSGKIYFQFISDADLATWYLASDRMPGMTQFRGGETFHFDLIPAWDWPTFVEFFQNCLGVTMIQNGATLTGNPHECGAGRISAAHNVVVGAPPSADTSWPSNWIIDTNPDQTGTKRYFPLTSADKGHFVLHGHQ